MFRIVAVLLLIVCTFSTLYYLAGGEYKVANVFLTSGKAKLKNRANQFWEDIQFKGFQAAAAHHEQHLSDTIDISYLIQRLFLIKPEILEIIDYQILPVHDTLMIFK